MAKTAPIGVRFRPELLADIKEKFGVDSPQKALVFYERLYVQFHKQISHLDVLRIKKTTIVEKKKSGQPPEDTEAIRRQISFLEAELPPPDKKTWHDKKDWQIQQDKKIQQLKSKLT